jgi:hypothetical protein
MFVSVLAQAKIVTFWTTIKNRMVVGAILKQVNFA